MKFYNRKVQKIYTMSSQFSHDGKYFALLSEEGKLKIWNAVNGSFEQEYTPDYHLSCPCTCLQFISSQSTNKGSSPKKKKKRESLEANNCYIVLGTTKGLLLGYSITSAKVTFTVNSKLNQEISCLSWIGGNTIYSGANQNILCWDLEKQILKDKWSCGNEKITALREIPQSKLLVASKIIRLWDIKSKEILRTYTGHSSEVSLLEYIPLKENSDSYFLSGSKNDRLLNCWTLSENSEEKNAIASFLMEDVAQHVSIVSSGDNITNMATLTKSGQIHVYQHTLNGKCSKPLKPKTTIQVASDNADGVVVPIPIMGVLFQMDLSLLVCHGSTILLTFENVVINMHEKIQCLVRSDPKTLKAAKQNETSKFRTPILNNNVQYLTPHTSTIGVKRKQDGTQEVPMEQRLENLTLTKSDISNVPKVENVAQLLIQGIHSKDKNILKSVLNQRDEMIIKNTIKRLPITVITPLVEELTNLLQGKTASSYVASLWLKNLLQIHAALLLSNPQLSELLGPTLQSIQSRLTLQMPLAKLKGRLNLLMLQINSSYTEENNENENALLVYRDKDSSDSENENMDIPQNFESENEEWSEEESEVENKENDSESEEDSAMSS